MKKCSRKIWMMPILVIAVLFIGCRGTSPRIHHSDAGKSAHFPAQIFPVPHTMEFEIEDRIVAKAHRKSILGIRISGEKVEAPGVKSMGRGMTYYLERKAAWNALEEGGYDGIYVIRTHVDRGGILPPLYRREKAVVHGYGIRIVSFDRVDDIDRQNLLMARKLLEDSAVPQKGLLSRMFQPIRHLLTPLFPFLLLMPNQD